MLIGKTLYSEAKVVGRKNCHWRK